MISNIHPFPRLKNWCCLALILLAASAAEAQTYIDLDFNHPVQATNSTVSGLNNTPVYTGTTMEFTNVGTYSGSSIDLRLTATVFGSGYQWVGHAPDYVQGTSPTAGVASGDLGVVYQATSNTAGGTTYKLEFYQGGGTFTNRLTIPDLHLLVYDVDGESSQSEKVSGYFADGLFGYRIGTIANSVTAAYTSVGGNGMIFSGAGTNLPETSVGGAAILYYQNTNTLTLRFDANTTSGASGFSPNGVFSGIDGDLSMLGAGASGGTADYTGFTAFIPVPEPSSGLLAILPLAGFLLIMRRRS